MAWAGGGDGREEERRGGRRAKKEDARQGERERHSDTVPQFCTFET
jgi:hypothetical protein